MIQPVPVLTMRLLYISRWFKTQNRDVAFTEDKAQSSGTKTQKKININKNKTCILRYIKNCWKYVIVKKAELLNVA